MRYESSQNATMPITFHKNLKAFVNNQVIINTFVSVYVYQIKKYTPLPSPPRVKFKMAALSWSTWT